MVDYKERYDEALKKAKYWHKEGYGKGCQEVVEDIFPELAESEDERIMKEIADFIYISTFKPKDLKKKEKWLTWLEKQCRKNL